MSAVLEAPGVGTSSITTTTTTLAFDEFPDTLSVFLVKNVKNCGHLRQLLVSASLHPEAAIINATLVPDLFILHAAARAALVAAERSSLKTRSLHAEIVFNVAASKHIGESLNRYGVNENCNHILVARFNASQEEIEQLTSVIDGECVASNAMPSELSALENRDMLVKYHKIADEELRIGSLVDAVVTRMAVRDMM